jgi:hypothetical protein
MKETLNQVSYPLFTLEVSRDECRFPSLEALAEYFEACISEHPLALLVGRFDHLSHTGRLSEGWVDNEIQGAMSIVFCFGITLPDPTAMATRPRSIGITDLGDRWMISFLEAPMPVVNAALERWSRGVAKDAVAGQHAQQGQSARIPALDEY